MIQEITETKDQIMKEDGAPRLSKHLTVVSLKRAIKTKPPINEF